MSIQKRSVLQSYFQKGNIPKQEQFADLIDSCVNLEEDGISVDANQNIGIGTISPSAKLHVAGKIFATEFQGAGSGITNLNSQNLQGQITSDQIQALDVAKLTGQLAVDQIPELDANKITSGTLDNSRIPELSTSKITAGVFSVDRIPNLPREKIIGLPEVPTAQKTGLQFHIDKPFIKSGEIVTLTFSSPGSDMVGLRWVGNAMAWGSGSDLEHEKTYQLNPSQTCVYTIAAYTTNILQEHTIQEQRQFTVYVEDSATQRPDTLRFHVDRPNIRAGDIVTLTFSSSNCNRVVLEYILENQIKTVEWNSNLDQEQSYQFKPNETRLYSLTAYEDSYIKDQRQFTVQVILTEEQSLTNLQNSNYRHLSAFLKDSDLMSLVQRWFENKDEDLIIHLNRFIDRKLAEEKIAKAEREKQPHQAVVPYMIGRNIQEIPMLTWPDWNFSLKRDENSVYSAPNYEGNAYYPLMTTEKNKPFEDPNIPWSEENIYGKIYRQFPEAGSIVEPGTVIDLWYIQ
ncbi:MAG: PASTA domain-containing protein [Pegethrix bostrychoides GSE-TBD4-15B]|jgi:hypothetical protein|uniref:PASTA domain-containing protein n=1 Tax=Pegethrix bostrychoides GSE-TBD4-15B TaxID=2839662 RepID=A0A951PFR0_9CYAN|nr:PASTA domain-containing protein [Pegethrix bostrychoides GSE-TBD4-15B]